VTEQLPQLLGDVRRERCEHQHEPLGDRPGIRRLRQVVVELDQLRDRGVEAQPSMSARTPSTVRCTSARRVVDAGQVVRIAPAPRRRGCATRAAGTGTCRRRRGSPTGATRRAAPSPSRTGAACRPVCLGDVVRGDRRSSGSCPSCPTRASPGALEEVASVALFDLGPPRRTSPARPCTRRRGCSPG
jgi:hypothetical protein